MCQFIQPFWAQQNQADMYTTETYQVYICWKNNWECLIKTVHGKVCYPSRIFWSAIWNWFMEKFAFYAEKYNENSSRRCLLFLHFSVNIAINHSFWTTFFQSDIGCWKCWSRGKNNILTDFFKKLYQTSEKLGGIMKNSFLSALRKHQNPPSHQYWW